MESHDELLEAAKQAANRLHADMRVSQSTTREDLQDLVAHIRNLIETLTEAGQHQRRHRDSQPARGDQPERNRVMSKFNPAKVNEALGVFVLERNRMPSAEKMMRTGEILAAELTRVNAARDENAVALAAAVKRADESERREKVMRDALEPFAKFASKLLLMGGTSRRRAASTDYSCKRPMREALRTAAELPGNAEEMPVSFEWRFAQACFTRAGAEAYLDANAHNLGRLARRSRKDGTRIYVESAYRNAEMIALREAMLAAHKHVGKEVARG